MVCSSSLESQLAAPGTVPARAASVAVCSAGWFGAMVTGILSVLKVTIWAIGAAATQSPVFQIQRGQSPICLTWLSLVIDWAGLVRGDEGISLIDCTDLTDCRTQAGAWSFGRSRGQSLRRRWSSDCRGCAARRWNLSGLPRGQSPRDWLQW